MVLSATFESRKSSSHTFGISANHGIGASSAATGAFAGSRERERSIIIIDNRARERERLVQNLKSSYFHAAVAVFATIDELRRAHEYHRPISAILLNIGGVKITDSGVSRDIEQLNSEFAAIPFVIVADNDDPAQIPNALETGACGYIPTAVGIGVAVGAIELALAGGVCVPANCTFAMRQRIFARNIQGAQPIRSILTARQIEVAEALRCGKANKIIAYELNLRESTVKVHIRKIMKKLNATNRTEAVYKMDTMLLGDASVSG